MAGVIAIETATEACSVAVLRDGQCNERHEITPRRHNQRVFAMLRELLQGQVVARWIDVIAYGCGPGSFTGLRIAASAAQGLAFAADLPAVAVDTLECQARTAIRHRNLGEGDCVLSLIDARINEVYHALYRVENGAAIELQGPRATAPGDLQLHHPGGAIHAVGSGCRLVDAFPDSTRQALETLDENLLPEARDLIAPALAKFERGETLRPAEIQPLYVREEISWKKLAEQGKRA